MSSASGTSKLGNNETNNSPAEASHVLRNSLARVQMALVASGPLMLIYNVQPRVEHQISNSNKSHMGRVYLDCVRGTPLNDPYNSLMNSRYVDIEKSGKQLSVAMITYENGCPSCCILTIFSYTLSFLFYYIYIFYFTISILDTQGVLAYFLWNS